MTYAAFPLMVKCKSDKKILAWGEFDSFETPTKHIAELSSGEFTGKTALAPL